MRLKAIGRFFVVATFAGSVGLTTAADNPNDWPMYGRDIHRTAYNPNETKINRTSVGLLIPKWVFHAGDAITASPVVVNFDHFGPLGTEPPKKVVYVGSADEKFYAVDAADGSLAWPTPFTADTAPTAGYNTFVSSAFVDKGRGQLYVGGGFTMYAIDLYTGTLKWKWSTANKGGGEVESSPVMVNGKVYFGSDLDGKEPSVTQPYAAFYALDADFGTLQWYWRPSKRATPQTCGSVWDSPAVDTDEGLLYFATADCTRSHQDLYNESIIALPIEPGSLNPTTFERTDLPNWYYSPRDIDAYDYDFGASPLLFEAGGKKYLGIGGKDGFFYVIERQKWAITGGIRTPKWTQRVVRGGFAAGFIGSSATDGQRIWSATALFDTPPSPNPQLQPPYMHAFNVDGTIAWQQIASGPTFAATTAVPGVVFIGSVDGLVQALDGETGQVLWVSPLIGAISSGGAISDGEFFIGAGTTAKAYGLGQGALNGLFAFHLPPGVAGLPAGLPPKLPPAIWPLGVLQYPVPADANTAAPTPTPGP